MKSNEMVDGDQTKLLHSIKKYLQQIKESGVPFYVVLNELNKNKVFIVGVVSASLIAIIGLLEIPMATKVGLYFLLILFTILFYYLFPGLLHLLYGSSSKRMFIPYVKQLATLKHEDFKEFGNIHRWYVSLEGGEYKTSFKEMLRGKKIDPSDIDALSPPRNEPTTRHIPELDTYLSNWKKKTSGFDSVLILGPAGTGKSTLLRQLAYNWAKEWLENKKLPIPLFIPLRKWIPEKRVKGIRLAEIAIEQHFRKDNGLEKFKWADFKQLVKSGAVILLLDGFDELIITADANISENYIESITEIMSTRSKVIFTSRPEAFSSWQDISQVFPLITEKKLDPQLARIKFQPLKLNFLNEDLIKKIVELRIQHDDELKEKGFDLNVLTDYVNLERLAERPILLYYIFEYFKLLETPQDYQRFQGILSRQFSEKKLYDEYIDNWFKKEEKRKELFTKRSDRLPLIRDLAWKSLENGLILNFSQIQASINTHFPSINPKRIPKIEQDVRDACLLEYLDCRDVYQFHHKSFAEYFVADDIAISESEEEADSKYKRFWALDAVSQKAILVFATEGLCRVIIKDNQPLKSRDNKTKQVWITGWIHYGEFDSNAVDLLPKHDVFLSEYAEENDMISELLDPSCFFIQYKEGDLVSLSLEGLNLKKLPKILSQSLFININFLKLNQNRLDIISQQLLLFTQLNSLKISRNQLTEVPAEICQLTQLEYLDLSGNQLTEVPTEICQLSQLTDLNLSGNQLTEVPTEICQLTQLTDLNLSDNQLTEVPTEICQLTQLTDLNLSDNQLTEVPAEICQLTQLTDLNLSDIQLTEVPTEICQLTQLRSLVLSGNQLTEVPAEICQLSQLEYLDLSGNQFTEVPAEICQLSQLATLNLHGNQFTEVPAEICQLSQLEYLDLSGNQLTEVPAEICQLTQLTDLDLANNQLTEVLTEICQLTQLHYFDLSGNQLTEVPTEICQLTQLRSLDLNGNQLTEVPTEICQLTQLYLLGLRNNQLTEVPAEICQLSQLEYLDLSGNQLTEVPKKVKEFIANVKRTNF